VEPIAWWAVLFATYLAIISKISPTELVVGALTAAAGAAAAVVTRRTLSATDGPESYRPRREWVRWLRPLPLQIPRDAVRLLRPRGDFAEMRLPADDRAAALRGFAALAVSTSPGTYVTEVDPGRGVFVVHRVGGLSAVEREVTR
jgi:multisubunit Na+/H+ antiporter MnhE subunit